MAQLKDLLVSGASRLLGPLSGTDITATAFYGTLNGNATSATNADTVDNVHLEWAGSQAAGSTTWLAGWTSDGTKIKAVKQADLSVGYSPKTTLLYADNSPYRYNDANPYYAHMTWNTNSDNRWYLRVYPETPKQIAVDYAYNATNADKVDNYHATDLLRKAGDVSIGGGDGNTVGYHLSYTWNISTWSNHRAVFLVRSRHNGAGLLSISCGNNSATITKANVYGEIIYCGPRSSGSIIPSDAWQLYVSDDGTKVYLFCKYSDYTTAVVTSLSGVELNNPGTWMTSITGYGSLLANVSRTWVVGDSVTGAVWNDYAECRESDCTDFGYVLVEKGDDTLTKSTERLQPFAGVSSDTWGFSQGETETAKTPIAVAGRVLVYPYQNRNNYKPGDCVCAAPGGTVDIMTREEVRDYPDRIVGIVSCVPDYEEWGGGANADRDPVKVNGRIWIKVR